MPYALGDPLSAGLAAASGVMAGQQAKKQRDAEMKRQAMLDAQAQADTQARLGLERSNQEATQQSRKVAQEQGAERLRNEQTRLGIEQQNAARAQAMADAEAQKQKLLDTFKSEERDFFSHEMSLSPDPVKRLGQLQKRYDIERGKGYDTKSTEAQMNKAATEIEQQRRDNAPAKPTYRDLHPQPRAGRVPSARDAYFAAHGYDPPTYSEAHPKLKEKPPSIPQQRSADADAAQGTIDKGGDYDKITRHYAAKWNIPLSRAQEELAPK